MSEQLVTARQAVQQWLDVIMADKVMYMRVIDHACAKEIGLAENTIENIVRIVRDASNELIGTELSSGRITNILIEKKKALWKIVVFKAKRQMSQPEHS